MIRKRPDYATIVYCNLIRKVYKKVPIIIGGIEAVLDDWHMLHDYWSNALKHSILMDSAGKYPDLWNGYEHSCRIADALDSGLLRRLSHMCMVQFTMQKNLDSVYDS